MQPTAKTSYIMKIFSVVFISVFIATHLLADDFKLSDGKEYKGVTVTRVEPDGIMVMTDSGIEKLPFALLPKEVQQKYNYNPQTAANYTAQTASAQHNLFQKQQAAQQDAASTAEQGQQAENAAKEEAAKPRVRIIGNIERIDATGILVKYYLDASNPMVRLPGGGPNRPKLMEFGEYFITGHPNQADLVDGNGIDVDAVSDGNIHTDAGETFAKFKVVAAYKDPFR